MNQNILIFTSEICYPPRSGGSLAIYERIKILSEEKNIHLFSLDTSIAQEHVKFLDEIKKYTVAQFIFEKRKINNLFFKVLAKLNDIFLKSKPSAVYLINKININIENYIRDNNIKYILIDGFPAITFIKFIKSKDFIYISHNAESSLARQKMEIEKNIFIKLALYVDFLKIKKYEQWLFINANKVYVFSDNDLKNLSIIKRKNILIHPPLVEPPKNFNTLIKKEKKYALITTNLEHSPNYISMLWFIKQVMPYINKDTHIYVTGRDKKNLLNEVSNTYKNISYLGFVTNEELHDFFCNAELVINPTIIGSGVQMKLMEALAYNKNIVTTNFSNVYNLPLPSSDDPKEFAYLINEIMNHNEYKKSKFNYSIFFEKEKRKILDSI